MNAHTWWQAIATIRTALGFTPARDRAAPRAARAWTAASTSGQRFPAGLGPWGTQEFIEPQVRRLVAEHLGVGVEELGPLVSLRDELAMDSLDLLDLALGLEGEFGIAVPDRLLNAVRSYGDLVDTTVRLLLAPTDAQKNTAGEPLYIWARLRRPDGLADGTLERGGLLTPYLAETIAQDAHLAGPGAQLEIMVALGTSDTELARVHDRFAPLLRPGVRVHVRRSDPAGAVSEAASPDEALFTRRSDAMAAEPLPLRPAATVSVEPRPGAAKEVVCLPRGSARVPAATHPSPTAA
jgi:acyl carrier protein